MDYDKFNNEELARRANLGDTMAEEALLRRFKSHVKMLARPYFIMGGDRDDLVQEGMIGLYKAIREFCLEKNSSFAAFATICIKNQMIDAIKSASRKKHSPLNTYVSMDGENHELASIADIGQEPESIFFHKEIKNVLKMVLTDLEAAILSMHLEGRTYNEIAESLGRSAKAVDNALFRARRKLSKLKTEN